MSTARGSRAARRTSAQQPRSPYLDAAVAIARQLTRDAVAAGGGVTWRGDDLVGDEADFSIVHGPVGPDLYGGAAGIAWFLGHIAAYLGSESFASAAVDGLRFALGTATDELSPAGLSLYAGAAGVALAAVEVGECLHHAHLRRAGVELALQIAEMVGDGRTLPDTDLISGSSGIVIALLSVHRRAAHDGLVGACRAICEQLIGIRQPKLVGCGWPASDAAPDAPPLCGLGHGASGSAWALAETAWATGDRHLLGVAREALRYERGWFSSERCAWPDLRLAAAESAGAENWPGWTTAWCHGAIGIGAVRLRLFEIGHEMNALAEASAAIQAARSLAVQAGAALAQGVASDVTLCHGLGGAIELALLAAEVLELEDHLRAARRIGDLCLNIHRLNGQRWTCGLRNADKVPGLFLGLAGIGVTMMRLHDPTLIGTPMLAGRLPRPRRAGPHGPATP